MSNHGSDGAQENEWDDPGELAWNEFEWERYLREQDAVLDRYLGFYEKHQSRADRLDHVAHLMGWDDESWAAEDEGGAAAEVLADETPAYDENDPYTLHKNPIYIATKAISLGLQRAWERVAIDPTKVPQAAALRIHSALHRCEEQAMLAIQALDFGDYAMAISLFKRALRELNASFTLLSEPTLDEYRAVVAVRKDLFPRLFDLREVWLRVMSECREELSQPSENEDDEED
jgi:hypothetical protein